MKKLIKSTISALKLRLNAVKILLKCDNFILVHTHKEQVKVLHDEHCLHCAMAKLVTVGVLSAIQEFEQEKTLQEAKKILKQ